MAEIIEPIEKYGLSKHSRAKVLFSKIGIVGCGSVGQELVITASKHGIEVTFLELSEQLISHSLDEIRKQLDHEINHWGLTPGEKNAIMSRIRGTLSYHDFSECELVIEAIKSTQAADGNSIDAAEVREINTWLRANHLTDWTTLHGDDEDGAETGFHLVQNDGAQTQLYGRNAVNTVADGIYHLGFVIEGNRLVNEDGDKNESLNSVSDWLNDLLATDLANGSLLDGVALVGVTGAGVSVLV